MYCIKCDAESEGKYCAICGTKQVASKEIGLRWKHKYVEYSEDKLKSILLRADEYQEDAVTVAQFVLDNYEKYLDEQNSTINENDSNGDEWYYGVKGERKGPINTDRLLELYHSGVINLDTVIWKEGMREWTPFKYVDVKFCNEQETPPPLAVGDLNNKWLIVLLFAPLLSSLIQYLIAGWLNVDVSKMWWLGYLLNTLCCHLDCVQLKKAGHNTYRLLVGWTFVVPVYIFKRMNLVNDKKWFFTIAWIVVMTVDMLLPDLFWVKTVNMSNPSMISFVKDGSFNKYPDVEVGILFDDNLSNSEWDTYVGTDRQVYVRVTGELNECELETIFEVFMEDSFDVCGMTIDGDSCSNLEINNILEYLYANQ